MKGDDTDGSQGCGEREPGLLYRNGCCGVSTSITSGLALHPAGKVQIGLLEEMIEHLAKESIVRGRLQQLE